ncbi:MAG: dissimilatory-type sulfite reductase subunit beta [Chloroflexota bacterium]|nr:dissimilatory-type sulfite reductase subunit beta [Chloroflexota bacterium]
MPGLGVPQLETILPDKIKRNYGQWIAHESPKPGVLKHIAESGEELVSIRAGTPGNARLSVSTVRQLANLADKYSGGHVRITQRKSWEFVDVAPEQVDALIADLKALGFPVGGTNRTFRNVFACTGWLHCQFAATDAPGLAQVISDNLFEYFVEDKLPAQLKVSVSGCVNNCGNAMTADIGLVGIHRDIPRVDDAGVAKCEIPLIISICPVGAIKPKAPKSIEIDQERCIHCPACSAQCSAVHIGNAETDGVAIFVGGKAANTGNGPSLAKLAVPYLPNNTPRWHEVTAAVRKIVETWAAGAKQDERIGEWIERIGWEKLFQRTGFPMTFKHVDGFVMGSRAARANVRFRW